MEKAWKRLEKGLEKAAALVGLVGVQVAGWAPLLGRSSLRATFAKAFARKRRAGWRWVALGGAGEREGKRRRAGIQRRADGGAGHAEPRGGEERRGEARRGLVGGLVALLRWC